MKILILPFTALAAVASLSACQPETQVVDSRAPDPLADQKAKAPKAELPPPIRATVSMRCKDNSLVFVDFFQGDKLANLRISKDASSIRLTADNAGDPLTGNGYSLTGNEKSITLNQPGKDAITCRA